MQEHLAHMNIDLKQRVQQIQHTQDSKLYMSSCKLAISVWLWQWLAFYFLHPARRSLLKEDHCLIEIECTLLCLSMNQALMKKFS
jgi:hypothetical protein